MKRLIIAFLPLLAASFAWILESNFEQVEIGVSQNVQLICRNDASHKDSNMLTAIDRIRILQLDPFGIKTTLLEIRAKSNTVVFDKTLQLQATGNADLSQGEAYLKATWPTANQGTPGKYLCQVSGFNEFQDFSNVEVKGKVIKERVLTMSDVNKAILAVKQHYDVELGDLESVVANLTAELKKNVQAIHQRMEDYHKQPTPAPLPEWPEGDFALIKPISSRCPADGTDMFKAMTYDKIGVQSSDQDLNMRDLFGLEIDYEGGSSYSLTYCVKQASSGNPWPMGTYCIPSSVEKCPAGFSKGFSKYPYQKGSKEGVYTISYCCRSDGDASSPIVLPTESSFLVYRYKGKCQEVANMFVSGRLLQFRTYEGVKVNSVLSSSRSVRPDSSSAGAVLNLCHYNSE